MAGSIDGFLRESLGDAVVQGFRWMNKGEDLEISFSRPGDRGKATVILFRWVTELEIEMRFGKLFGQPLIHEAALESAEAPSRISSSFGGAPEGGVRFRFSEAEIHKES